MKVTGVCLLTAIFGVSSLFAADIPRIEHRDGRFALIVDGKPYIVLGAQVGNSSGWPDKLDSLWPQAKALQVNTLEVPVYWEQIEAQEGRFDFSVVDNLLQQARSHNVRLILLWFGTWKNGKMHYVPEWVKSDTSRFPRMMTREQKPIDVLSPNAPANEKADATAFAALMEHLKQVDSERHTVLLLQVENESGSLGSVRDFSPMAQKIFDAPVPAAIVRSLHKPEGTWAAVFGDDADEAFAAWSTASYIDHVAEAGKQRMPLPMYCNNWLKSPRGYPILTIPGEDYPSGGPTSNMYEMWKAAAPHIDILAPDIYVANTGLYISVMEQFKRPDNALFIPETLGFGSFLGSEGNARNEFLALGEGAIGFAPFGIDNIHLAADGSLDGEAAGFAANNALLGPMSTELAQLQFEGKLRTAVEQPGLEQIELTFGRWSALVTFPPDYNSGLPTDRLSPTARLRMGRVLVAQLGPDDFLVAGIDARVNFRLTPPTHGAQAQLISVTEGRYEDLNWLPGRIWNGDETDYGLTFRSSGKALRVKLGTY